MSNANEIADLITRGLTGPTGGQDIAVHTGYIQTWDELSGVNSVTVNGAQLSNLLVVESGVGVAYQSGDVVIVLRKQTQYFILGKVGAPGAGAANQVRSATVNAAVNQGLQAFGDLTGSFGPELVNVYIGSSRRCLVTLSNQVNVNNSIGNMGFQVRGASLIDASVPRSTYLSARTSSNGTIASVSITTLLTAADGLNMGFNTFTTKYRVLNNGEPGDPAGTGAQFQARIITVQPF